MGQMASGLAHELNQPLGAIANYSMACRAMLTGGADKRDRVIEALHDIQSEALRAGEIINRLRGFVKKQQPNARPRDVNEIVNDTLRLMAFDLRSAGVKPALDLPGHLPPVLADSVQIGQVLVNLVRNALDAMLEVPIADRGLAITTARTAGGFVSIAITDRGCGAPKEALPRIFDAFFTTKPSGLGIGLSLCRTIVEDHGGKLSAENNAAGGMTFSLTLRAEG
jgi:C4-dicarboxylate-specific signal transduction histidine kinase